MNANHTTGLKLYLLGEPSIELDGKSLTVDTRKAVALIAYLAITRASHSREALAALLYPDYDEAHARAALRRTISALKQALADGWLEIERESIGLNQAAPLWVDVDRFHRLLAECQEYSRDAASQCSQCLAPLEEAVRLYRDDFMAGFTLRDSPNFDEWQFFQTEGLRRGLTRALAALVCCHSEVGNLEAAIQHARRWLALDPLDESAHRQLMRLYSWMGQRAAALRQYRECVRLLQSELGVAPLEETTRLEEEIEQNRVPKARSQIPNLQTPNVRTETLTQIQTPILQLQNQRYPLVGRSRELARMLQQYEAMQGNGRLIVIEGEAGIGKTRLAEEFLALVRARGGQVVATRCYEGETTLAYGPFVEGLRAQDLQSDHVRTLPAQVLSEASRLLPELASLQPNVPPPPVAESPGAQTRFYESITQVVMAVCAGGRDGILFIDDLQWADAASLDVLTYFVRRLKGRPLLVLVTWRGEEVGPDHRLRQLLAEVQREGIATDIHLSPLDRGAVAELVESTRGTDQALAERLYRETEGQPFFLVEYLGLLSSGEEREETEWSLPGGVRELLRSRVKRVGETARQLLGAAAVIGRSFDFDLVREVSGRSEMETATALEELTAYGLISEVRSGGESPTPAYDFQHEKLRGLVYIETSLARRRLLHRRVAEALLNRARLPREVNPLAGLIAGQFREAGLGREAAEYYRLAGEYARSIYANREALEDFRSALGLGYPDAAVLHEAIGDLETLSGDYAAALNSYETAAAHREEKGAGDLEAKIANVYLRRGEWELAASHFQAALVALGEEETTASVRSRIYEDWSLAEHRRGDEGRALELATRGLDMASADGDKRALAHAHNILGILARARNDLDGALAHLEQSLALAEELGEPGTRTAALNNLALLYKDSGDWTRGLDYAGRALALSSSQGDRHREAALHNNIADLLHASGRSEEAMEHLKQAVGIYAEIGGQPGDWQPEIWKLEEW